MQSLPGRFWGKVMLEANYILILFAFVYGGSGNPCVPGDFGKGSIVCVCNATYCDEVKTPTGSDVEHGKALIYTSTKGGQRLQVSTGTFTKHDNGDGNACMLEEYDAIIVNIESGVRYQSILGFGGAFTDAAAHNLFKISKETRRKILHKYFNAVTGIGYTLARVPIGGTDFSVRPYTYMDKEGSEEPVFTLQNEDLQGKIPLIKAANLILNSTHVNRINLTLLASPWSAPAHWKTNGHINGDGLFNMLKRNRYDDWADYFIKFFEEYDRHDIRFWGFTTQNEPTKGLVPYFPFNSMGWMPTDMATFVGSYLGPKLETSKFRDVKVIVGDDDRMAVMGFGGNVLNNEKARKYIHGVGLHWYMDTLISTDVLDEFTTKYPEQYLLFTEACEGFIAPPAVILGSWERAENYASSIAENLNHHVIGWLDWNMVLDPTGYPNWAGLPADSPVIVDAEKDEAYFQPMFYAMSHFSKFIPKNSKRMGFNVSNESKMGQKLVVTVAERPDEGITVVMINKNNFPLNVVICDGERGALSVELPDRSIQTVVYW